MEFIGYREGKYQTPVYKAIAKMGYSSKGWKIIEYGLNKSIINANNDVYTITDEEAINRMSKKKEYSNFIYIEPEFRQVIDVLQEDTTEPTVTSTLNRKTYGGPINSLESNQIFVFGSNTEGRHGKGAALVAKQKFGANYGQAEGLQGQSYGIITKDLTKTDHPSRTADQIKEQIIKLYEFAKQNPDKEFVIAYSGEGTNLNAYSSQEMANMFGSFDIPNNVIFEEKFNKLLPNITEDRSLNVGAKIGQESSPSVAQDRLQNRLENNNPLC